MKQFNPLVKIHLFSLLILSAVLMSCSISDRHSLEDSEGVVPDSFFESVKKYQTDKQWVIENLGFPYAKERGNEHEEIYTYRFAHTHYREASMLIALRFQGSEKEIRHYHILFCDDIVRTSWWDEFPSVQVSNVVKRYKCKVKKEKHQDKSASKMHSKANNTQLEMPEPKMEVREQSVLVTESESESEAKTKSMPMLAEADSVNAKVSTTDLPVEGVYERIYHLLNHDNQFATNSILINPKYKQLLIEAAALLQQLPPFTLHIVGYADGRGNKVLNIELSRKRAQAVADTLINEGLTTQSLRIIAAGNLNPLYEEKNDADQLVNRAVTIDIMMKSLL